MLSELNETLSLSEPPDPVTSISISKSEEIGSDYILCWQSSNSMSRLADNYTIIIVIDDNTTLPSQTYSTSTSCLHLNLSSFTNYTVLVKASNCVGESSQEMFHIYTDEGWLRGGA